MKKYRGIVVGVGAIGALLETERNRPKPATHAGALSRNPRTELVAIVDRDTDVLAKAGKIFPQAAVYTDVEEALIQEQPDIVAIATPANSHLEVIRACIKQNVRMIICEKPIAATSEETEEIHKLLLESETVFVLNYQRRYFTLFERVRGAIEKGDLGRTQHVTCYYSNGLYNNGGHTIDALDFLLSDPIISVNAEQTVGACPPGDINVHALLTTESGVHITLIPLDQDAYGIHELRIYGTKGKYSLTEYGYALTMAPVGTSVFKNVKQLVYGKATRREFKESMVAGSLADALSAYEHARPPKSGVENGARVMRVLDAIAKSVRENKRVILVSETL